MSKISRFLLLPFLVLIGYQTAFAQDSINYKIHQQYISPRAMGMGNAFTAVANDYDAVLYNPAGLARIEENEMSFFIRGAVDPKVQPLMDDISKASEGSNSTAELSKVITANYGKVYGARITPLGWLWGRKNWGLAFIPADASVDIGVNQLTGPSINSKAYVDSTLAFGYGKDIKVGNEDRLSWGFTAKGIYRGFFNRNLAAIDLAVDKNVVRLQDIKEGITADIDLGIMYSPSVNRGFWKGFKYFQPTFSIVGRNLADVGYFSNMHLFNKDSKNDPEKLGRRTDIGASFKMPDWWVFTSRLAVDFKDIGHRYYTFEKGFHLGAEFNWKVASWFQGGWRVGMSQSYNPAKYWSAGFTGRFAIFQTDLVSYAEEIGTSEAKKENRKYMVQLSMTF